MRAAGQRLLAIALASPVGFASGADQAAPLGSLMVEERPWELRVDNVRPVSIVTRPMIEGRHAASAADLLRELPGVHVDRLGPSGSANVYVRGGEPNHTLVLVDGVRMNDPTDVRGGSVDLSALSPDEIERIEVLAGASSAQFGADAMGGIINIVTRRGVAGAAQAEGGLGVGGRGFGEGNVRFASPAARIQAGFGATYREDGEVEDGGRSRLSTADGSLGIDLGRAGGVTVVARYARREARGFPESSGGRLATTHLLESREAVDRFVSASIADLPFMGSGRISMKASLSEREEDRDSPAIGPGPGGFVPATTVSSRFRRGVVGGNLQWEGIPFNSRALAGIEAWREDGLRDSVLRIGPGVAGSFRLERDTRAAFAQLDSEPSPGWRASLALRYDDVSAGEGRTSGSAGLSVKIAESSRVWVHWSDGFKPPSFFALGDTLVGNPGLRDESSRNAEIGFETTGKPATARLTAFSTRYRDLVDFDPVAFRMVNRTSAKIAGFEMWVAFPISPGLRVEGAYTFQDADLAEAGASLRNRPNHRASGSVSLSREEWSGRLVAAYVGSTLDFSVPTGEVRLPGFGTMDASIERRFRRWRLGLAFDNLLDKRYEQFVGYPAGGIRVRASVRAAFD